MNDFEFSNGRIQSDDDDGDANITFFLAAIANDSNDRYGDG